MRSLSVHAKCTSAPGPWRQMTAKQTASVGCYELPFCDAGHIWPSQIVGEPGKITVRRSPALNPACYLQSVATVCWSFIPRGVAFWRQINILPIFFNHYVKKKRGTDLFFGHCYQESSKILSKNKSVPFFVPFQTLIFAQRPPRQKPRNTIACADRYTPCNTHIPTNPRPRTGPAR